MCPAVTETQQSHLVEAINWNRIQDEKDVEAVSYTHLTLPTIYSV